MPRKRRTITIVLDSKTTDDEYAKIANAVWSVVNLTDRLHVVEPDHLASSADLNEWYDQDGRKYRWK